MTSFTNKNLLGKFCDSPFNTASIETPGTDDDTLYMYTCWCGGWTKTPIGNLEQVSVKDAWHSQQAQQIRTSVIDGSFYYCDSIDGCSTIHRLDDLPKILPPVQELPTQLMIRIDRSCNLSCPSCRNEVYNEKQKYSKHKEVLEKIIDAYKDFDKEVIVMLDGSGEFLASKAYRDTLFSDRFPRCFKYQLMTNATLLTKYKSTLELLGESLDSFIITLDAATSETYSIVRRNGNFDDMIDGIKLINDMGITWFSSFVTQKDNCHEMLDYYYLAKDLNANEIQLSATTRWDHMTEEFYNQNDFDNLVKLAHVREQMERLIELKKTDYSLNFAGKLNNYKPTTIIPTLNLDK